MKQFFAKEFLWLVVTLVLALPIAFLWLMGLDVVSADDDFTDDENIFVIELFLLAYAVGVLGIYLLRMIAGAIKVLAQSGAEAKK